MGGIDPHAEARHRRRERAARRAATDHVLVAFARVGATRRPGPPAFDPTRADRSSTRRHGATRHGQARDTAALVAHAETMAPGALEAMRTGRPLEPAAS